MKDKKDMTYRDLLQGYVDKKYELECYGSVKEPVRGKDEYYRLYKMILNPEYEKTLLTTTGFHGEEFNGPISLLNIIDEATAFAKEMETRLIVYPCISPSGLDLHQRYNPTDDVGDNGNNDFLRYEIEKDNWIGTLEAGQTFLNYKTVESAAKEVRLLQRDLLKYQNPVPQAVLDIHQDDNVKNGQGNFYAYIFDQRPVYLEIMRKLAQITDVCKNIEASNTEGDREVSYRIDNDGFIFLHDGSITDMFYRLGSKFCVCAETNTDLPLEEVSQINLIWIKELIKLIAK
jgi:hypothetical protein